jgi:hypothetical protein
VLSNGSVVSNASGTGTLRASYLDEKGNVVKVYSADDPFGKYVTGIDLAKDADMRRGKDMAYDPRISRGYEDMYGGKYYPYPGDFQEFHHREEIQKYKDRMAKLEYELHSERLRSPGRVIDTEVAAENRNLKALLAELVIQFGDCDGEYASMKVCSAVTLEPTPDLVMRLDPMSTDIILSARPRNNRSV